MGNITAAFLNGKALSEVWAWRDKDGGFHNPRDMETRHLFYTLRMIWNHSMPLKVGNNIRFYNFSSYYTKSYMRAAIRQIGVELSRRRDLEPEWLVQLQQMAEFFRTSTFALPEPQPRLERTQD